MASRVPKRTQTGDDEGFVGILDALKTGSSVREEKDEGFGGVEAQVAALTERLEGLSRQNEALMQANSHLMTQHMVNRQPGLDALPDPVDVDDSIDPLMDKDDFTRALDRRIMTLVENSQGAQDNLYASQTQINESAEQMWSDYSEWNPDWADVPEKVEYAVSRVTANAQKRGYNLEQYMFANTQQFFADIDAEMVAVFGEPAGEGEGDDGGDDSLDRTGGLFPGGAPEGMPRSRAPKEGQPGDMMKDIQDLQRESGFW